MNMIKAALLAATLVGSSIAPADADAHGRYRYRSSVGIYFGIPGPFFYSPYYYAPRYYHPPAYYPPAHYPQYPPAVVPSPSYPPVYIEQPAAAPSPAPTAQTSTAYWYYCRDTQTYYPYVQQCASPWQPVVPNSVPSSAPPS